ncbi:MAG: hypothetical protein KDK54_19760 [Leptospiraceae bacterium]|nr:hypothetical protein [Leptospiraceae bacterium]
MELQIEDILNLNPRHDAGKYRKVTRWMVDFCEGDFKEAIVLSYLISYHSYIKETRQVLKNKIHKFNIKLDDSIVFSYNTIREETLSAIKGREKLKSILDKLKKKNVLKSTDSMVKGSASVYTFNETPIIEFVTRKYGTIFEGKREPVELRKLKQEKQILQRVANQRQTNQKTAKEETTHKNWSNFLEWSQMNLTPNTLISVKKIKLISEDQNSITIQITSNLSEITKQTIKKYYSEKEVRFLQ